MTNIISLHPIILFTSVPKETNAFLGGYNNDNVLTNRCVSSNMPTTKDPFHIMTLSKRANSFDQCQSNQIKTKGDTAPENIRMFSFALYASNKNNDPEKQKQKTPPPPPPPPNAFSYMEEPRLVAVDLLAFLIVCELIGLTDILISSGFWKQGGFLQPVTISSFSNMELLIKRDSLMSICWILSSIYNRGYSYSAISSDVSVLKSSFTIFTDYCSLLILSALGMAVLGGGGVPVDVFELAREAWFTILVLGGFRYAYSYSQRW